MEKEIYKLYKDGIRSKIEVSNYGNVKRNGKQIILNYNQRYMYCGPTYIHRAVAELFVPNPNNYDTVDHIDGNKHNNHYTNLRWCTRKMNMNNPITKNRLKESATNRIMTNIERNKISNTIKSKGLKWMHNKNTSKQVPQVEQQHYIDNGWCFGRI